MFSPNFFPQQAITSDRFRDLTPVAGYDSSDASDTWSEDYTDYESDEEETPVGEKAVAGLTRKKRAAAALTEIRQSMLTAASVAPRQPSWDEAQSGRKRCVRCRRYYTEKGYFESPSNLPAPPSPPRLIDHDEDVPVVPYTPSFSDSPSPVPSSSTSSAPSSSPSAPAAGQQGCFYHPGQFTETALTNGLRGGWSCCRDNFGGNAKAYVKTSQGCRFSPFHREDMLYTNTILKFGFSPSAQAEYDLKMAAQEAEYQAKQAKVVATTTAVFTPLSCKENPDLFHEHIVTPLDTLEGLSLRYGVPSSEIRRLNRFQTIPEMQIIGRLFIPKKIGETPIAPPKQPRPDGSVAAFQVATRASIAEAKYYLAETEGNVEEAIQLWQTDLAWEQQQS